METNYKEKDLVTIKIYTIESIKSVVLFSEKKLKGSFLPDTIEQLFESLKGFERIIGIDSLFKNNYSTTDTGIY